jgi:hypothetical protein
MKMHRRTRVETGNGLVDDLRSKKDRAITMKENSDHWEQNLGELPGRRALEGCWQRRRVGHIKGGQYAPSREQVVNGNQTEEES